jgi:phage terminase small subunit
VKKAKKNKVTPLTPQQKRFCREYVVDLNGKQAAIRAKYSLKAAEVQASHLLSLTKVKDYVAVLQKKLQDETNISAKKVIAEFAKIAFSNVGDFIEENNEITDLSKLNRDKLATVESIQSDIRHDGGDSQGYTEKVKLKFHSKVSALENLGKHLGIYAENNKVILEILPPVIK